MNKKIKQALLVAGLLSVSMTAQAGNPVIPERQEYRAVEIDQDFQEFVQEQANAEPLLFDLFDYVHVDLNNYAAQSTKNNRNAILLELIRDVFAQMQNLGWFGQELNDASEIDDANYSLLTTDDERQNFVRTPTPLFDLREGLAPFSHRLVRASQVN